MKQIFLTVVISLLASVRGDEGMDLMFILSGSNLPRYMGQEVGGEERLRQSVFS